MAGVFKLSIIFQTNIFPKIKQQKILKLAFKNDHLEKISSGNQFLGFEPGLESLVESRQTNFLRFAIIKPRQFKTRIQHNSMIWVI